MQINRHTYEEFFLLYADGELNISEKKAVEEFVGQNPDLQPEFDLLLQTIMLPDDSIIFEEKELLYKEEDGSKVVPFRWFRIAVAAILLLAFGFAGWLYIGEKEIIRQPVAVIEKPVPVTPEQKSGSSAAATASAEPEDPLDKTDETLQKPVAKNKASNGSTKRATKIELKESKKPIEEIEGISEPQISNTIPDPAVVRQHIARTPSTRKNIDVTVNPRELNNIQEPENNNVYYAQMEQESNNDMIYFANTSISKKTKLRGVFRKATRFLDKVTSLQ